MGRESAHRLIAPLPFAGLVLCVIAAFLALDHFADPREQLLLGAATWLILGAACLPLDRHDRTQTLLVVLLATSAELVGSILWGAYTYRLHNLPSFVPPGHGLVYLAGARISQAGPVRRHQRAFVRAAIAVLGAWGAAGLLCPGHGDELGAITGVALIYVLIRGRAAPLYAGVFCVVAFLEIYGTSIGAWHWAATVPGTSLSEGNPPSGIAAAYVLFDIGAIALASRLLALLDGLGGAVEQRSRRHAAQFRYALQLHR